ncbi:helix-turn-helix domain-containing protein [Paraconexibacter antarcticus]|uniref:helix-turn-helix domain-containing protein n=1 Tax=Paraconexibacter antarcticus TaxID=2949664 RepID=UPI0034611969
MTALAKDGKEGVIGSNPIESFIRFPRTRGGFLFPGSRSNPRPAPYWGVCGALGAPEAPHRRPFPRTTFGRGWFPGWHDRASEPSVFCHVSAEPTTPFDDLEPSAVLTAQEVAARLRVDARSVRRAVSRGDLPASRACGLRILAADAASWWRSRRVNANAAPELPLELLATADAARPVRRKARRRSSSAERLPLPPRSGGGR